MTTSDLKIWNLNKQLIKNNHDGEENFCEVIQYFWSTLSWKTFRPFMCVKHCLKIINSFNCSTPPARPGAPLRVLLPAVIAPNGHDFHYFNSWNNKQMANSPLCESNWGKLVLREGGNVNMEGVFKFKFFKIRF